MKNVSVTLTFWLEMTGVTSDTCCICLEPYDAIAVPYSLACGHLVHAKCMLEVCLHSLERKCPYCRSELRVETGETTDDAFEDAEVAEAPPPAEASADLPQWRSTTHLEVPVSWVIERQRRVAQKLLSKARNKHAPKIMKSCLEKEKLLRTALEKARGDRREFEVSFVRGKVSAVCEVIARQRSNLAAQICKVERRLATHTRRTLRVCQRSRACIRYLEEHPLKTV